MVIKRSSSAEVASLIDGLLGPDPARREAAAARLAILGSRAIERLVSTLAGLRDTDQVLRVLDVLDRIPDARSLDAALPFLSHHDAAVVDAAIGIARHALQAEDEEFAVAATDALVAVAVDRTRLESVRHAAVDALSDLPADVLAPLQQRLGPEFVQVTTPSSDQTMSPADTLTAWSTAADASLTAEDVRRLVGQISTVAPLALLQRLVDRLRAVEEAASPEHRPEWRNVRGAVHQALAMRDSRVAFYDLREMLERTPHDLTVSMIGALARLGDASDVETIAVSWAAAPTPWLKQQFEDVLRSIVAREALTRRHAPLKRVAERYADLFERLSMPLQTRPAPAPPRRT